MIKSIGYAAKHSASSQEPFGLGRDKADPEVRSHDVVDMASLKREREDA